MPRLRVTCRLLSPFHTASERYSNMRTCAPYVLGSTLRGAVLGQVIQRCCNPEDFARLLEDNPGYHTTGCGGGCGAKGLFDRAHTRFSFGWFGVWPSEAECAADTFFQVEPARLRMVSRSRVAVDRARGSVAEGALLQLEAIPRSLVVGDEVPEALRGRPLPAGFRFEAECPDQDAPLLLQAVAWAGQMGIGAFRNQGFGRFEVVGEAEQVSESPPDPWPAGDHVLSMVTPYVLPAGKPLGKEALRCDLDQALGEGWSALYLADVRVLQANLGYVGRWSLEDGGHRHTRAVALPGSLLGIRLQHPVPSQDVARISRGLGEWDDVGFGRLALVRL